MLGEMLHRWASPGQPLGAFAFSSSWVIECQHRYLISPQIHVQTQRLAMEAPARFILYTLDLYKMLFSMSYRLE